VRLLPDFPEALDGLARILSCDPDPGLRDGKQAVQLAERACELTKREQPSMLTTLAAAYAETGRFTDAISSAQAARALALSTGQKETAAEIQTMLDRLNSGQPLRDTP
jgi:hypothetical protein